MGSGAGGSSGENLKFCCHVYRMFLVMAKYHFFHSHCLCVCVCVCIVSMGKRLELREVRGTSFRSRFDKLVILSLHWWSHRNSRSSTGGV